MVDRMTDEERKREEQYTPKTVPSDLAQTRSLPHGFGPLDVIGRLLLHIVGREQRLSDLLFVGHNASFSQIELTEVKENGNG